VLAISPRSVRLLVRAATRGKIGKRKEGKEKKRKKKKNESRSFGVNTFRYKPVCNGQSSSQADGFWKNKKKEKEKENSRAAVIVLRPRLVNVPYIGDFTDDP